MCNILKDEEVKTYLNDSDDEEDYSIYGLDENEIEEVKKGNQSIFDFEEDLDEVEDDDYYGEDDI